MVTKKLWVLFIFFFLIGIVSATDYTPQGDIDLQGFYAIKNATNITSNYYCNATNKTQCYTLANLLLVYNYTHLSNFTDDLGISSDWDEIGDVPVASPSNGDSTHLSTADQIYDWVIGLAYATQSWVTSQLSSYATISNLVSYIGNWSSDKPNYYNKTQIDSFNDSWSSTYNSTYASNMANNSFNQTFTDKIYSNITWAYNQTIPAISYTDSIISANNASWMSTYNSTYASNLDTNDSSTIASMNSSWLSTYNATYAGFISFNHTNFINNLTNFDCGAGYLAIGIQANGTILCAADQVGAPGAGDIESVQGDNIYIYNGSDSGSVKLAFNESKLNNTIVNQGILSGFNSTYNSTYENYITTNQSNRSNYWDNMGTINATQMQDNGGTLNILESWLTTFVNSISTLINYFTKTEIQNQYYNKTQSYNKSEVDNNFTLYYTKVQTDNNFTYYLLLTDQRFNETSTINNNNASWSSTFNSTYNTWAYNQTTSSIDNINSRFWNTTQSYNRTQIDTNLTLYLLITDQRYNETGIINLNNASWMSTYNATYAAIVSDNATWNESRANALYAGIQWGYNMTTPFTNWLSTFAYNYNQTTPAITYTDSVVSANNASWMSTYNSTYASMTDTNDTKSIQDMNASWLSTYNETYAGFTDTNESVYIQANEANWLTTYNLTYHNFISANISNRSYNWAISNNGTVNGINITWLDNVAGFLSFKLTQLEKWFAGKLTEINNNINGNLTAAKTYSNQIMNNNLTAINNNINLNNTNAKTYTNTNIVGNLSLTMLANGSRIGTGNFNFGGFNISGIDNLTSNKVCNSTNCYTLVNFLTDTTGADSWTGNASSYYNKTQIDNNFTTVIAAGKLYSDNNLTYYYTKVQTDNNLSLYYLKTQIDNNFSLYLLLTDQRYNETAVINANNASWMSTYNETYAGFADTNDSTTIANMNASWLSTYNATYATNIVNNSWNESRANALYAGIEWDYNQTTPAIAYTDSINDTLATWVNAIYLKIVDAFDGTWASLTGKPTHLSNFTDNILWTAGFNGTGDGKWLSTYNATYHNYVTANISNSTSWWAGLKGFANSWLYNNGSGYLVFNESKVNYTISVEGIRLGFNSTYNSTYASVVNNASYLNNNTYNYNQTTPAITASHNKSANINPGAYNITLGDNKYICFGDSGCADSYMYFNGSSLITKVN